MFTYYQESHEVKLKVKRPSDFNLHQHKKEVVDLESLVGGGNFPSREINHIKIGLVVGELWMFKNRLAG